MSLTEIQIDDIVGLSRPPESATPVGLTYSASTKYRWVAFPQFDTAKLEGIEAGAEKNTGVSLGSGIPVFTSKVGSEFRFRTLRAGSGVTLTATSNEITVSANGLEGGATSFLTLNDTPDVFNGAGRVVIINPSNNGLTFGSPIGTAAYKAEGDFATSTHGHSSATTSTAGFLSAADKSKLDGIQSNAEVNDAANRGTGSPVYFAKNAGALEFRSIRVNGGALSITHDDNEIVISGSASAGGSFVGLSDTPSSMTGANNKVVKVNATGNALEFGNVLGTAAYQPSTAFATAVHTHDASAIVGLEALVASEVAESGGITQTQGDARYAALAHNHTIADTTGLQAALDGKAATSHTHTTAQVTGLDTALAGKAATSHTHVATDISNSTTIGRGVLTAGSTSAARAAIDAAQTAHTHAIADTTGLQTALDGKAATSHTHTTAQVTGLDTALAGKAATGANSFSGTQNLQDNIVQRPHLQDFSEVVNARGSISGAQTIDLELGNVVTATITGATTFTFSNPAASGRSHSFMLRLTNGGAGAITWPTSVKWPGGTAATFTAAGRDRVFFTTEDAGVTWDAVVLKDFK